MDANQKGRGKMIWLFAIIKAFSAIIAIYGCYRLGGRDAVMTAAGLFAFLSISFDREIK